MTLLAARCLAAGLGALLASVSDASAAQGPDAGGLESLSAAELYAEYYERYCELFPTVAMEDGARGIDAVEVAIDPAHREAQRTLHTEFLEAALALSNDREQAAAAASLEHALFLDQRASALRELARPDHLMPVNHFHGLWKFYSQLAAGDSYAPFETIEDYDAFLQTASDLEEWVAVAIANMRAGVERGLVPPKLTVQLALAEIDGMLSDDPTATPFWGAIRVLPPEIDGAQRERLTEAWREAVVEVLVPAYRRLAAFLQDEYLGQCRASLGWSALPDGEAWYAELVAHYTTTDLTPGEVHDLGLREVERIAPLLAASREAANGSPRTFYESPEEIAAAYRERLATASERLDALFGIAPTTPLEFLPSPHGTFYEPGAPDGSRAGVFRFAWYGRPQPLSEATFAHEAIPGHHYQIMLQRESPQPAFRKQHLYNAFVEGWGLYAESLGGELGLYGDPWQAYTRYHSEMWRALRLVWDTGIHAYGWSLEDCAEFAAPHGFGMQEIRWELERYVAWPGQALSYKVGELEILAARTRAEEQLGERFDLAAFHRFLLETGAVPLGMLRERVETWVADRARLDGGER